MFTELELKSIYNLLRRATLEGLDEARAAVLLSQKIEALLKDFEQKRA